MKKVINMTEFKGSFDEFLTFLRTDSQFYFTSEDELLNEYRMICKKADAELPKFFGLLPRLPYGVKPIPDYQAPASPTAYYYSGSQEAGRAGFFMANTYKLETRPKYEMEALSIHEAVPGHHLQITLAQELDNIPKFRRYGGYTAFVEGWGLYSEKLAEEMGFYEDPYSKFGQLTYEMWRACRLVVDTGMHTLGWTRQEAIDFMLSNTAKTENDVTVEIDRYIAWPGQALAYKIGELKIRELRSKAEKEMGDNFNIRDFHDVVLGHGAVPLDILEKHVNEYILQIQ
jgi:prolyl oligopeptidase